MLIQFLDDPQPHLNVGNGFQGLEARCGGLPSSDVLKDVLTIASTSPGKSTVQLYDFPIELKSPFSQRVSQLALFDGRYIYMSRHDIPMIIRCPFQVPGLRLTYHLQPYFSRYIPFNSPKKIDPKRMVGSSNQNRPEKKWQTKSPWLRRWSSTWAAAAAKRAKPRAPHRSWWCLRAWGERSMARVP